MDMNKQKSGGNSPGAKIINRKGGGGRGYPASMGGSNMNTGQHAGGHDSGANIITRGGGGGMGRPAGPLSPNDQKSGSATGSKIINRKGGGGLSGGSK